MYDGGGNGLVCLQSITVYTKILSMGYFMLSFLKKVHILPFLNRCCCFRMFH